MIKSYALGLGTVLFCLGFMCLPLGFGASPKRHLSLFNNFADLGSFAGTGLWLMGAGILVIAVTLIFSHVLRNIPRPTARKSQKHGTHGTP